MLTPYTKPVFYDQIVVTAYNCNINVLLAGPDYICFSFFY